MTIEYYEVKDVDNIAKVVREVLERFDFIEEAVIFGSVLRRMHEEREKKRQRQQGPQ